MEIVYSFLTTSLKRPSEHKHLMKIATITVSFRTVNEKKTGELLSVGREIIAFSEQLRLEKGKLKC